MRADELDFVLPPELIAQEPLAERAASRLLHYRRDGDAMHHRRFGDLPSLLRPGDLLVFNDARVLPARFHLQKQTGGQIEGLFVRELRPGAWEVMLKNLGGQVGARLRFIQAPEIGVLVTGRGEEGLYQMELSTDVSAARLLQRVGRMPLPPYIHRDKGNDRRDDQDRQSYQTIYAKTPGSVAAPTAGLHFTPQLLQELEERGVQRAFVTLHVGLGTFKPVASETLQGHAMHREAYTLDESVAAALNRAKAEGRRIIAVGTTSARVLESQPADRPFAATSDQTGIFIYPPYRWKHVQGLITNFHLPRSTLIALVAALVGLQTQRRLYQQAIAERYRFFSYGDAMFVE